MKKFRTLMAGGFAALVLAGAVSTPAAAATEAAVIPMTSGVDGCLSYSYEPGTVSTTVYYHNRCSDRHVLYIHWFTTNDQIAVEGGGSGKKKRHDKVMSVWQFL
ncbi:hypothetical protein ACWC98_06635 [Streptomyces goshikiensis]|uniref:hypothetical protein n=1 Tax=Streptomyces goshikiensis TaxID=1942 RepID=UPI0036B078DB